ncbi:MAG: hypothetical protein CW338_06545 [Clostridiales bacterium]|nr:hypothetical protein [Clostridiales bacterium]
MSAAAKGLKKLFRARILIFAATVMLFFADAPVFIEVLSVVMGLLAILATMVGVVLEIFAFRAAIPAEIGYRTAFQLAMGEVIAVIVSVVLGFFFDYAGSEMSFMYRVIEILIAWYAVTTTVTLLQDAGFEKEARLGKVTVVFILAGYLGIICTDLGNILGNWSVYESVPYAIAATVVSGITVIGEFLYVLFLGKARKRL